jgi:hypothetical protein
LIEVSTVVLLVLKKTVGFLGYPCYPYSPGPFLLFLRDHPAEQLHVLRNLDSDTPLDIHQDQPAGISNALIPHDQLPAIRRPDDFGPVAVPANLEMPLGQPLITC